VPTDYYPLLLRAVAALGTNTVELRRALYERVRTVQIAQLDNLEPGLTRSEFERERAALEAAIRKIESEAAPQRSTSPSPIRTTPLTAEQHRPRSAQLRSYNPNRNSRTDQPSELTASLIERKQCSTPEVHFFDQKVKTRIERAVEVQRQSKLADLSAPTQLPSLEERSSAATAMKLMDAFGGRLPTWGEFKQASGRGRVHPNISIALRSMWWSGMPITYAVFYGFFIASVSLLIIPTAIVLYLFATISGWWLIASIILATYLFGVTKRGACMTMITGAERHQHLYRMLVVRGAFLFEPSDLG
jgi:hypothetical protein